MMNLASLRPAARLLAATLALLAATPLLPAGEPPLLKNPGFEQSLHHQPDGWQTDGETSLNNEDFYDGKLALMMAHTAPRISFASQTFSAPAGKHFLQLWIKIDGIKGEGAGVQLRNASGKVLAEKTGLTGTHGWERLLLPFEVEKPETVTLSLSLTNATGRVLFDEAALVADPPQAAPVPEKRGENLAFGKKATLLPQPNYPLCTDPEDTLQLTDGIFTKGYFWSQKSTVGWKSANPTIIIDLGKVEPIGRITLHTVGGGVAGVRFPEKITCHVSDDGEHFYPAATLTSGELFQGGLKWYPHPFASEPLKTRGRYVMLHIERSGNTFFTDEIEVERGDFDAASVVFTGTPLNRRQIAFAAWGLKPESYHRGHFPETPHIDWAIPLSGKAPRAIILNSTQTMRDVVEIVQRLDLDYTPLPFWSYYRPDETLPEFTLEQIRQNLPACEVMIVGGLRWKAISPEVQEAIRERVREGMGLVVVEVKPDWLAPVADFFTEAPLEGDQGLFDLLPMERIPAYRKPKKGGHFQLASYGKGRVAKVQPSRFTRSASFLLPGFELADYLDRTNGPLEYYFAAFNKLVLWAAQRETHGLASLEASPERLTVTTTSTPAGARLRVIVRNPFFEEIDRQVRDLPENGKSVVFTLPGKTPGGTYAVDVWLLDAKDRVIDYGATAYQIGHAETIREIAIAKPLFNEGEPVAATVHVQGATAGLTVRATLFDTEERQVSPMQEVPVAPSGEATLQLPYPHAHTLAARLFIELVKADTVLDARRERVWIDRPEPDDFSFIGWYAPSSQPSAAYAMKLLRGLGVDMYAALYTRKRVESAAYGNIRFAPENIAPVWTPEPAADDLVRVPCLTDPAHREKVETRLREMAREARPFGALEWSLGDEQKLAEREAYCLSPSCLAGFRTYLQGRYPDLPALNESWGSRFGTWEEVRPVPLQQLDPSGSLAPWVEHRRYMESVFAKYHARAHRVISGEIPRARVGLSGTQNQTSYNGYDWWKLMRAVDHLSGYGGVQVALQRSFMKPKTFFTTFLGYDYTDSDEQSARSKPWELLFNGANGINYYTLVSGSMDCPLFHTDLSPTRQAGWLFEEVAELKSGIGRLFMESRYGHDGIAIHYSPASRHVATAVGLDEAHNKRRKFEVNLMNVAKILTDTHYQYRFVHGEQIRAGELSREKVLFLPWSSAIGNEEAKAIRQFVEQGGTVIADAYCGIRDEHGKPADQLGDLFGVRQSLTPPALKDETMTITHAAGPTPAAVAVTSGSADLRLTGGTARGRVGETPALIVHRHGKGRAIFLNASFSNYAEEASGGVGGEIQIEKVSQLTVTQPIRQLVASLLKEAGVEPPVIVTSASEDVAEVKPSRFQLGEIGLLGVTRTREAGAVDREDRLACTIRFESPAYLYESRSGAFLGKKDRVETALVRGLPKVYAALPYAVKSLALSAAATARPGEVVKLEAAIEREGESQPGTHLFHLSVIGPDGKEKAVYAQNLLAGAGKTIAEIPFAYNDPAGEWKLQVRDVATGVTASTVIRLGTASL